jgi:hypothetical protein
MRHVVVIDQTPDARGRFHCFVDGGMQMLSIEALRAHVAATGQLDSRKEAKR